MPSVSAFLTLATALCASLTSAVPAPQSDAVAAAAAGPFWMGNIDHSKETAWLGPPGYQVFRDVSKLGVQPNTGQGVSDRLNQIIASGGRCGGLPAGNCDSATVTPAIIYFPPGEYIIDKPLQLYYYTQLIGDAVNRPVLKAAQGMTGMAMLDADPYGEGGVNWFTNQNNFFRQIRNFVIDVRGMDNGNTGAGIHWQVAQATSLQNIKFIMSTGAGTQQQGIFMDNGSGGFFSDLEFIGGKYGAFLGSQQFTVRNLVFRQCQTAIFMNWNWGWLLHNITVEDGVGTALDMSNAPQNQTVGSVILSDSNIKARYGVRFAYNNDNSNVPATGGTLILDNVNMQGTGAAVVDENNAVILNGGSVVRSWASGHGYAGLARGAQGNRLAPRKTQGPISAPNKPAGLLDANRNVYSRSKPQYEGRSVNDFISAKSNGCRGDGSTDDTNAINALLTRSANENKIAFFEHGAYLVKNTINVPPGAKMVGSIWSLILADGPSFNDVKNPKVVFRVGQKGQTGSVEISDFMFETKGAAPGAIMIEWNLASTQGGAGMWDTHVRIGGSAGTGLQGPGNLGNCRKTPEVQANNFDCQGVFLMFHATPSSSNVYLENTWFWVSDHDLDEGKPLQVSIYSARGVLVQSKGPIWFWGAASEHSTIYNWQIDGAQQVFSGFTQSETPYYQPNPLADVPFDFDSRYDDPTFTICTSDNPAVPCKDSWGLRIVNSKGVLLYGMGLYSFFNNYDQECVPGQNCQENMIRIQNSEVSMYAISTKAAVNMIVDQEYGSVKDSDNRSNFCATVSYYFTHQGQTQAYDAPPQAGNATS